jgi:hypothetical protein
MEIFLPLCVHKAARRLRGWFAGLAGRAKITCRRFLLMAVLDLFAARLSSGRAAKRIKGIPASSRLVAGVLASVAHIDLKSMPAEGSSGPPSENDALIIGAGQCGLFAVL